MTPLTGAAAGVAAVTLLSREGNRRWKCLRVGSELRPPSSVTLETNVITSPVAAGTVAPADDTVLIELLSLFVQSAAIFTTRLANADLIGAVDRML